MMRPASRLGAAAALLTLAVTAGGPAFAHKPTISFDPAVDSSYAAQPTFSGRANHDGGISRIGLDRVEISYETTLAQGAGSCAIPPAETHRPDGDPNVVEFTSTPTFECNGRYRIRAKARSDSGLQHEGDERDREINERFDIAIAPATPTGLSTAVDSGARRVTVRWADNTELDLLGYAVFRQAPGSTSFQIVEVVGSATYVDSDISDAGGTYRYEVQAIRLGPSQDPEAQDLVFSSGVGTASASVPRTTTTTSRTPSSGGGSGTATTSPPPTNAPLPATPDRSGIDQLRNEAAARRDALLNTTTTDPGYEDTLPFGEGRPSFGPGEGIEYAVGAPRETFVTVSDRMGVLGPVAGGLVLFVGAVQIRYLMRQVGRLEEAENVATAVEDVDI